MSSPELTLKEYLKVFNVVILKGEKENQLYNLEGIKAWHDFDGYTCFLGYKDVTLTLLFHGRYSFDYDKKENLSAFLVLLTKILKGVEHD